MSTWRTETKKVVCTPDHHSERSPFTHSAASVLPPLGFPFQKALSICLLFKWMRFNCEHNQICWCEKVFWTLCLQHTHRTVRGETCSPLHQMRSFMHLFWMRVGCFFQSFALRFETIFSFRWSLAGLHLSRKNVGDLLHRKR